MRYAVIKNDLVMNIIEIDPENVELFYDALGCDQLIESETLGIGDIHYPKVPDPAPMSEVEILKQQVEQSETEIAQLWYDNMLKDAKIEQSESEVAQLWYEVMQMGGM